MRCQVVRRNLQDLLEERLPARTAVEIRRHLSVCPACGGELSAWRHLWAQLDGLAPSQTAPDLEASIMALLDYDLALPKGLIFLFALASLGALGCLLPLAEGVPPIPGLLSAFFWTIAGAAGVLSVWYAVGRAVEAGKHDIAREDRPECYSN